MPFVGRAMSAPPMAAVQQVNDRAKEKQEIGQNAQQVRLVFLPEKSGCNREKR